MMNLVGLCVAFTISHTPSVHIVVCDWKTSCNMASATLWCAVPVLFFIRSSALGVLNLCAPMYGVRLSNAVCVSSDIPAYSAKWSTA